MLVDAFVRQLQAGNGHMQVLKLSDCHCKFTATGAKFLNAHVSASCKRPLMDASELLLKPLVQTFNQVLNQGVPPAWCTGLIHPSFKSGDPENLANYRGITVVVVLAKLYAMV